MKRTVARVAVSAAIYTIDRPYSYIVPEELNKTVLPGVRVLVPFGRGNKRSEGIVLSVGTEEPEAELKAIEAQLDPEPVLSAEQLQLALFMRDRFFCTLYEAARAMLPTGMWLKDGKRGVRDKTVKYVALAIDAEDARGLAEQKRRSRATQQAEILSLLALIGEAPVPEVLAYTGAGAQSVNSLHKAGLVDIEYREVFRRPIEKCAADTEPIVLNPEQKEAFDSLSKLIGTGKPEAALLYGVTGSGKTSVYISLVKDTISKGRRAIVLVPEIALTPQFVAIFSSHFGERVAVLHSSLSMGERYDEWKRIRSGEVDVVIGTRTAVLSPVDNIGLIVIDEEQEHTYKSEQNPRYSARDVAKYRCVRNGALLLLGSATPAVESMYAAKCGKYALFELKNRYNEQPMPRVLVANMRRELRAGNGGIFSSVLREEMEKNLACGEQTILFINRRGASGAVICGECGYSFECPNCSVTMTYHSVEKRLMCHYCGHTEPFTNVCPECGGMLKFVGAGTQRAEEELLGIFPEAKILRMDADSVMRAGSHERILEEFRRDRVPFLIGTQMVTKGLDFENVTLVGVLSADQSLYAPDYRARERAFSLMTQVVGRSGRGRKVGRAVIQTFTPENETITLAAKQDYIGFYEREIELRRLALSPPIRELISVTVSGIKENEVLSGILNILEALRHYLGEGYDILGPSPAGIVKVNNRYRYRLLVAGENNRKTRDAVGHVLREFSQDNKYRGLTAFADSDPMQ